MEANLVPAATTMETSVEETRIGLIGRIGNMAAQFSEVAGRTWEVARRNAKTYAAIGATAFVGTQAAELALNATPVVADGGNVPGAAEASSTKQTCISKLLRPPSVKQAVMYNPGRHNQETLIKGSYNGVAGCDSWQRLGKHREQIKKAGHWVDTEGNFWYPTDQDVADKNAAHKFALLGFATRGVYEERVNGHWEPARVRFINFVKNIVTGKIVARGKIEDHPIKID